MAFQKKQPTGNASTEMVVGAAAVALNKAVESIKEATASIEGLNAKSEDLQLKVADKESKIVDLDQMFAEKLRTHEVEFQLKIKENAEKVVTNLLAEQGKVAIKKSELDEINNELITLKAEFDQKVSAEVGKAKGIAESKMNSEIKLKEAEFNTKEAENKARIASLTQESAVYKQQADTFMKQLDAEREASIKRAQAGAIGSINVGAQETGRR